MKPKFKPKLTKDLGLAIRDLLEEVAQHADCENSAYYLGQALGRTTVRLEIFQAVQRLATEDSKPFEH